MTSSRTNRNSRTWFAAFPCPQEGIAGLGSYSQGAATGLQVYLQIFRIGMTGWCLFAPQRLN